MAAPETASPLLPTLQTQLDRLRQLNTRTIQANWRWSHQDMAVGELFSTAATSSWAIAPLNPKQHIAWDKGRQVLWLYQAIALPTSLSGYPVTGLILRLALTWWADDAQIYLNGEQLQSGDLFECFARLCLTPQVTPGETLRVAIRLVSPGHDEGALVRSQLIYELPDACPTPEPSFVADELTVLATLEPKTQPQIQTALSQLDWSSLSEPAPSHPNSPNSPSALNLWQSLSHQANQTPPHQTLTDPTLADPTLADQNSANQPVFIPALIHPFQQSLSHLRRTLAPLATPLKAREIQCIGHAHLDMAWLWPVEDTWRAAERTFQSVLALQQDFPELTYTHSSPALFEWLALNRPELFAQIQQQVHQGRWSIDAGLWIEPEFNLIGGEAIARQILYGQRFCQQHFGHISKIAWLPDSFGFCWQLPQLLTQGGIETFATLKLSWNDTTEFPYSLFWWQAPNGSRILSLMLPPIGVDIDPLKMANHLHHWQSQTGLTSALWLPGMGDHGGGPTRDMLEKARRWQNSPFFPALGFTSASEFIDHLPLQGDQPPAHQTGLRQPAPSAEPPAETLPSLPLWQDELYLELHRGCYTTHADQKQYNRRSEDLLYQAEVLATIAHLITAQPYPKADLDVAWKRLLFNQFHDILPGTSIPQVFTEANLAWEKVTEMGQYIARQSLDAIAACIHLPQPPHPAAKAFLVFNPHSWPQTSVVTLKILETDPAQQSFNRSVFTATLDQSPQPVPCQTHFTLREEQPVCDLSFLAENIPALGYQCYWLCPSEPSQKSSQPQPANPGSPLEASSAHPQSASQQAPYVLQNEWLQATVNPNTGQLDSLIEKTTQRETFSAPGNQLQTFEDKGQYWDAWNIDPDYESHPLPAPTLTAIQWLERGPICQRLQVSYQFQQSTLSHIYLLEAASPLLKIETSIHWQDSQVLLKANFPLALSAPTASYEIPFGAIARPTDPTTPAEKAKWEVPALRWADLSDDQFGVSILTDSKHGFDASQNHLRLTLLKSPLWPDPTADRGYHHFTYAIYPHPGSWQKARTVHHARALNRPFWVQTLPQSSPSQSSSRPLASRLGFLCISNPNLILAALKPAEDDPEAVILRCYEAHGESADLCLDNALGLKNPLNIEHCRVNLLEIPLAIQPATCIQPWEIATYKLEQFSPDISKVDLKATDVNKKSLTG